MAYTARLSTKGQIVIPKAVRDHLGLKPGDELAFSLVGEDQLLVSPVQLSQLDRVLARLHAEAKRSGVTRAQVDQAIREVRREMWAERQGEAQGPAKP